MLVNIQFLRFIAAMLVVLYHTSDHVFASGHQLGPVYGFGKAAGFAGVDVFFVISGFIMAWTTQTSSGLAASVSFARRRAARIYSGYWPFYFLALALFSWLGLHYVPNANLASSFFLWPTRLEHLLLAVSWTLIFEMWFYLLFAGLIAAGSSRRTVLLWTLTTLMLAWSLYSQFVRRAYDPGTLESMNVFEQYTAFPFLLEFLAGALLAGWLINNHRGPGWWMLTAGISLFLLGAHLNMLVFGGKLIQGYFILWRVLIFGSASVLILAGLVRLENRGLQLPVRFSLLAGGASYAIYLSHTIILEFTYRMGLNAALSRVSEPLAQLAFGLLAASIVIYSLLHYEWLERPLHRLFRRWLRV